MSFPRLLTISTVTMLLGLASASAQNLNSQDKKFMEDAAKGGMMEVQMGHLGMDKGSSPAVKTFSQHLINDHTKGNNQLMDLAKKKGVSLPADKPGAAASESFAKKTGTDFDKAFAKDAVEDHTKDIAEFEKEVKSGSDPDVKSWANQTLPTLRSHLSEAESIAK